MTSLLGIHSLSKAYGTQVLFEGISFTLSEGDRIGLLGPNGSGKSTLLKILVDEEQSDEGHVTRRKGLRLGYASQDPEFSSMSLEDAAAQYVQGRDNISIRTRAHTLLSKAQFTDFSQNATTLSGGWKKRLDIVRALMDDPDLLFLDEPTNHLDLEGILWLERFLKRENINYVIVSHDRYFLENISNKIIELNRCYPQGIFISKGNMSTYMQHKNEFLEAQTKRERGLRSVVRSETEWLKKSPKARTTKSQSRVQRAYQLMEELSEVKQRNKTSKVNIGFSAPERTSRKLLVTKNLTKSLGGKQLFSGVDLTLSPGTRLGIVGKNGTGKTTLLKLLSGSMPQDMGTVKYADQLRIVYFDQHREHISPDTSLRKALSPSGDTVNYRGQDIHVNGWARRFLFQPDRLELPVRCLSGGERARIHIAKLMLEPADILFLDEPTNDLDIPTLEVLEESLIEFSGAVVLISHDRCLMDRVCTQILGLGENNEQQFFADYSQWEKACQHTQPKKDSSSKSQTPPARTSRPKKMSYKEQKELEGMEESIISIETEMEALQKKIDDPLTQSDSQKSLEIYQRLAEAQQKHDKFFERWEILLEKANG